MTCARCRLAGAGLRYQGRARVQWFCVPCWTEIRETFDYTRWGLTARRVSAENGDAETSAQTPVPADPQDSAWNQQAPSLKALPRVHGDGSLLNSKRQGIAPATSADRRRAGLPGV